MHEVAPAPDTSLRERFAQAALARRTLFVARDAMTAAILDQQDVFVATADPVAQVSAESTSVAPVVFALAKPTSPKTWHARRAAAARQRKRRKAILAANLFDAAWYCRRYPDVVAAGMDPLAHFLEHGSYEGRSPGPDFDAMAYLARYPDVVSEGLEPWVHYTLHGKAEGRVTKSA